MADVSAGVPAAFNLGILFGEGPTPLSLFNPMPAPTGEAEGDVLSPAISDDREIEWATERVSGLLLVIPFAIDGPAAPTGFLRTPLAPTCPFSPFATDLVVRIPEFMSELRLTTPIAVIGRLARGRCSDIG